MKGDHPARDFGEYLIVRVHGHVRPSSIPPFRVNANGVQAAGLEARGPSLFRLED